MKVSLPKCIMWLERKGKLSPGYVRPFEILDRVGTVSDSLPLNLSSAHNVFYMWMLRKYEHPSYVLYYKPIELREDFTYVKRPIRTLDQKEQMLRSL